MRYQSPLRYPGGKGRLANFFKMLLRENDLVGCEYVEPYAGGASVAISLLLAEYASRVHINDLSRPVYAFWHSVVRDSDELCRRIRGARLSLREYRHQKAILLGGAGRVPLIDLGYAAFYVNRTSRSGILNEQAGPIGGNHQTGEWTVSARFTKKALVERIERIARESHRISIYNLDAELLLRTVVSTLPRSSLVYLDPPYYRNGRRLYLDFYEPTDHAVLAARALRIKQHWVISYDDVPEVRTLYSKQRVKRFLIPYSASSTPREGAEVMFFSDRLKTVAARDPARIAEGDFKRWIRTRFATSALS